MVTRRRRPHSIEEIELELGVSINLELYPNLFNPFLYGPVEYDHAVGALLTLLNVTWDHLTGTEGYPVLVVRSCT